MSYRTRRQRFPATDSAFDSIRGVAVVPAHRHDMLQIRSMVRRGVQPGRVGWIVDDYAAGRRFRAAEVWPGREIFAVLIKTLVIAGSTMMWQRIVPLFAFGMTPLLLQLVVGYRGRPTMRWP